MKIWTKIEWAIIVAATVLLLLLLTLFAYSHPHSDDFSYNNFLTQKGYWGASQFVYQYSGGRFFSTMLIFFNPLIKGSIAGYQCLTAAYFLVFVLSLFFFVQLLLRPYVPFKSLVFLYSFLLLSIGSFLPNLHEFAYWLCAEATYLSAATLWLWAIVMHVKLANQPNGKKGWLWLLLTLNTFALVGCSEVGMMLNFVPLTIHFLYRRQYSLLKNRGFWLSTIAFLVLVVIVSLSGGNHNRYQQTPFSGSMVLALSGGTYAAVFWLSKWAIIFMPLLCFYILFFGHRLQNWSAKASQFHFFTAKKVLISSLVFFWICQIAVVYVSGSTPEMRFEDVLFIFLLLAFLFAAQLMMQEQSDFFEMLKGNLHRGFKTLSFIYVVCIFLVIPNNAVHALWDVVSGNAAQYNEQHQKRYSYIQQQKADLIVVPPISVHPQLLYYQTLSCSPIPEHQDVLRNAFAEYFGKKWIYEYPCNSESNHYSFKELLKQKREQFFSKESK